MLAQDARQIVAESENRSRSKSQQYEGTLEVIGASNKVSIKRWDYRRIGSFGTSKAILRFTAPAEVKGVALLIVNHTDRASDQWMWTPAIERDRRIAAQDRSTRFFGTDFSFEDLEERDVDQFDYKLAGRRHHRWRGLLEDRIEAQAIEIVAIYVVAGLGSQGQLRCRADRELFAKTNSSAAFTTATFKTSAASGRREPWKCTTPIARAALF